jgi:hypothetical protein
VVNPDRDVTFVLLREVPEYEQLLVRTVGGPLPGDRILDSREHRWPLPEFLLVPGLFEGAEGRYVKVSESAVTDEQIATMRHVIRGAQYEWRPSTVDIDGDHSGKTDVDSPEGP